MGENNGSAKKVLIFPQKEGARQDYGEHEIVVTQQEILSNHILSEEEKLAICMVASIRAALKNNVKHYSAYGELLTTEQEILSYLVKDKKIMVDETDRKENTTYDIELDAFVHELANREVRK